MNILAEEWVLKLYLLANGIRINSCAEEEWKRLYQGPVSLSEYASTSGVCLAFEGNVYVNAPFIEQFTHRTQAELIYEDGFRVRCFSKEFIVRIIPVPAYHKLFYQEGNQKIIYTSMGVTHTDRCRVSPIGGCAWNCQFCNARVNVPYHRKSPRGMLETIKIASKDCFTPARHVLISGGTPKDEDEPWLDGVYEFLASESPIPVDIMLAPRSQPGYLRWLVGTGVNFLSVNLELWDEQRAQALIPQKFSRANRKGYLRFIEEAVSRFGLGRVQSLLILGSSIEPVENTLKGVRALVEIGCIPVLSPFRPSPDTQLAYRFPPTEEEMKIAYQESMEICGRIGNGILPGPKCVPCQHNTVSFPVGEGFSINESDTI